VAWFVAWGLEHRVLAGITALGVDEIFWGRGRKSEAFLTVIYQIDGHCRRLLWVGRKRTQATLHRGLDALGSDVLSGLKYVCSDMWKPYLTVLAQRAGQAVHILDRFHIAMHLNQAVDQVRRAESTRLKGQPMAERLKKTDVFRPKTGRQRRPRGTPRRTPIKLVRTGGRWRALRACSNESLGMIGGNDGRTNGN